jgi:hypothetical protein
MSAFQEFTNNLFVEHDDVFMRLFVQTLGMPESGLEIYMLPQLVHGNH